MKKDVLIVIDMQKDFINGTLANKDAEAMVPALSRFIENWDGILVTTQDTHVDDEGYMTIDNEFVIPYFQSQEGKILPYLHCVWQTDGWKLDEQIEEACNKFAEKNGKDAFERVTKKSFGYTNWKHILDSKEINRIVLTGTCTDICVVSNAIILKALYPETEIYVLADLCAGLTKEKHDAALNVMDSCQIKVIKSEDFVL